MSLGSGGLGSAGLLDAPVHGDLLDTLTRAFPATVTIEAATETQNPDGEVVVTWTAVYSDLRGTLSQAVGVASERQRETMTVATATHVLALAGYYPAITVRDRARVARSASDAAAAFDVVAVRHDSQAQMTRLELETVTH